jgi:hypothetical protein
MRYSFRGPTLESLLSIDIVASAVNSSLAAFLDIATIGKWFDAEHQQPLKSIDKRIIFWLFQMPSAFKYNVENIDRIRNFESKAKLVSRAFMAGLERT